MPPSEREGDRVSGGRSLRDFWFVLTLLLRALPHPTSSGAPSRREPLGSCNLRGMGFARCPRCLQRSNTKAKLAIKGQYIMNQREYIKFLNVIEKLKCNTRHSWTSSGRHESVAEHSWRLAVMAMLCADE